MGRRNCSFLLRALFVLVVLIIMLTNSAGEASEDLSKKGEPIVITLGQAIELALKQNKEINQAQQIIEGVKGQAKIVNSRFFPHLNVISDYTRTRNGFDGISKEESYQNSVRVTQRLFEFGKDLYEDVILREDQREALFDYQEKVREVFFNVRRTYFSIILKEEQIRTRQGYLESFKERLKRARLRFEKGIILESDFLTAELDFVNEELRINTLQRDLFKKKMELLQLIGKPMGNSFNLKGKLEDFNIPEDKCIDIAIGNSIEMALLSEELKEQRRVVREMAWEYAPSLSFRLGRSEINEITKSDVGLELSNSNYTWGLDLAGEYTFLKDKGIPNGIDPDVPKDWFANFQVTIPLFEGFRRKGKLEFERAMLGELEAKLQGEREFVELDVRREYQTLLEARERTRIQERIVELSKRRMEINQTLKEFGKITDDQLEIFRDKFFQDQDIYFDEQDNYIEAQERLRKIMGFFD